MLATLGLPAGYSLATAAAAAQGGATPSVGQGASGTLRVGCGPDAYATIGAAIAAAESGDTILVCPGTYHENVVVPAAKSLTIDGLGHPVIDASSTVPGPGVQVLSSNSTVEQLTVENAVGEGILVGATPGNPGTGVSDVTIRGDVVVGNDQGNPSGGPITDSPYPQCNETPQTPPAPPIPGDCGEGIHLLGATGSVVSGNLVTGNSGGILLTDENGPTSNNVISGNVVSDNVYDCGVTMAGHNTEANGGVYDNQVLDNKITGNGIEGEGGGVLLASPVDGTSLATGGAVYDNVVAGNHIAMNGLAAVTVHSHFQYQDLNGNVIEDNHIGTNNLAPDHDYASFGYFDAKTTGVIVATLADVSITIEHNVIAKNELGIWLAGINAATIDATGLGTNLFPQVTTTVSTAAMP